MRCRTQHPLIIGIGIGEPARLELAGRRHEAQALFVRAGLQGSPACRSRLRLPGRGSTQRVRSQNLCVTPASNPDDVSPPRMPVNGPELLTVLVRAPLLAMRE